MKGNAINEYCTACHATQVHYILDDALIDMGAGKAIARVRCCHCKKEGSVFLAKDQVQAYKDYRKKEEEEKQWLIR